MRNMLHDGSITAGKRSAAFTTDLWFLPPLAMVVSGDILHATCSIMPDLACEVFCIMHWYPVRTLGNRCFSRP